MKLSQRAIEEFKNLYQEDYGVVLSDTEANTLGVTLLQLANLIIPDSEEVR